MTRFRSERTARAVTAAILVLAAAACSTPAPVVGEVPSAEVLYERGLTILAGRRLMLVIPYTDYQKAIDAFQEVIDNYPYSEYAVLAELRIADAYFDNQRYEEALSYYQEFPALHPNHDRVPYTYLRAALCHYKRARSANRDQGETRAALEQIDVLLKRFPYSQEAEEGELLWRELRTRLARHVMLIGDFYLKREEFEAAADRYRSVLNDYPGLGVDAESLYKLAVCYSQLQLEDEAQQIYEIILENYHGTNVAEAVAKLVPHAQ